MPTFISPTQSDTLAALRAALLGILPAGYEVVLGQDNRVPEPKPKNFVVMTPTRRSRLETNTDAFDDCRLIGAIAGTTLTASTVDYGSIRPGRTLWGAGVTAGTSIVKQLTGASGGVGTYQIAPAQSVAQELMACGTIDASAGYALTVQLDFHGPGATTGAADAAQTVSTLFRDDYMVQAIAASGVDATPLHADEPKQIPFINDAGQYEDRWVVEATLQVNVTISVPQQYMDKAVVGVIDVDERYPP